MGVVQPEIFVSLMAAWLIVFFTICKGIQSSGKVVFFTALVPFLILGVLVTRGVTLDGADMGLAYYLVPDWKKILDYSVWQRAAEQVFFSLGVAQGMIITMGSYNEFGNDLYSFVGGIVVFSVLGNMAYELHLDVPDVVSSGFGLAFITYPQAVSALSFPNLWAAAFFTMLFFLALGSQIAFAESLLSPLKDRIDYLHEHRTMLAAAACLIGFVLGIPLTTQVICISSIITSKPLTLGDYVYPTWVQIIGELLVFVPILAMAGGGLLHFFKCKGRIPFGCRVARCDQKPVSRLLRTLHKQLLKPTRGALPQGLPWDFPPLLCRIKARSFFHSCHYFRTRRRRLPQAVCEVGCASTRNPGRVIAPLPSDCQEPETIAWKARERRMRTGERHQRRWDRHSIKRGTGSSDRHLADVAACQHSQHCLIRTLCVFAGYKSSTCSVFESSSCWSSVYSEQASVRRTPATRS
ncbi:hypothetical protein V5799_033139 [Amblyomma americanum]|uniref:Sodium-dependent nutrient amino acid transporter 1 n=1 Tax=Amblyomma americanum TaxID=6943 RepID=A0AAQ4DP59_AMBAM